MRVLVVHELLTKDFLSSELAQLEARLRTEMGQGEGRLRSEINDLESRLREEIRGQGRAQDRRMDALMLQIRALQFGGAIAAFALGAIALLARLIR